VGKKWAKTETKKSRAAGGMLIGVRKNMVVEKEGREQKEVMLEDRSGRGSVKNNKNLCER